MYKFEEFLIKNPNYGLSSQYGFCDGDFNTIISFYNYYDQIFPDYKVDVNLNLFFFDKYGNQADHREIFVGYKEKINFDFRKNKIKNSGIFALAAVPVDDLSSYNKNNLKIKKIISTGYYVKWENNFGFNDIMHEWDLLTINKINKKKFYVSYYLNKPNLYNNLILMNTVFHDSFIANPILRLINKSKSIIEGEIKLGSMKPMSSKIILLDDCFNNFNKKIRNDEILIVEVESENLTEPMTFQVYNNGDFHIHHM